MAKPMPTIQLPDRVRKEMIETLADDIRMFLREHGHLNRTFNFDPDTPISVVVGALRILYGDEFEREIGGHIDLLDSGPSGCFPSVYLREDPLQKV